ncbi:MAG TPA: GntR family transcriptional regulator [Solirubrobacteraceae bacterium]
MSVKQSSSFGLTTATTRLIADSGDDPGGRAELVARRLGDAIRLGLVLDGERLPPEAQLAAELGVSTVTLREALTSLREQGLVTTRRGRGGGTFVHTPPDPGEPLRRFSVQELRDLGDQRCAIAGAAARLAAERALPDEVLRLERQVGRLRAAGTASERRRADSQLTVEVAAAAQSPRLAREDARLRAEVGDLLGLELDDVDHEALVRDREQLVAAIARHEPALARELAEAHVSAETARLIRLRLRSGARPEAEPLRRIAGELERVFAALEDLGARFGALVAGGELRREDLEPLRPPIFGVLAAHRGLVAGAGIITAPGLLADAPRWLEWWFTGARGAPEPLRVNLDPAAPDFYDYATADWYATPERTREPRMAGPYVDLACTNEYAITLSVPVVCGGAMAGVAAADLLVASVEERVRPALAGLDRSLALTNADGRVIASNSAALPPGERLPAGAPAAGSVRSWLLVEPQPAASAAPATSDSSLP